MIPTVAPYGSIVAALIVRTDRRIIQDLRDADAITPERAITLHGHGLRRARTRRLASAGAIEAASGGRYYLVEQGWRDYNARRRKRVLFAVAISAVLLLIGILILG